MGLPVTIQTIAGRRQTRRIEEHRVFLTSSSAMHRIREGDEVIEKRNDLDASAISSHS
jgi:hypothetical protein